MVDDFNFNFQWISLRYDFEELFSLFTLQTIRISL